MDDRYNNEVHICVCVCVCVCVYFPQFCDIINLVEKNSQIYIGKKKIPKFF
jgi:acetyl-CoA carboxylase carboxyltransferase component